VLHSLIQRDNGIIRDRKEKKPIRSDKANSNFIIKDNWIDERKINIDKVLDIKNIIFFF
jgi:hypothetical protein